MCQLRWDSRKQSLLSLDNLTKATYTIAIAVCVTIRGSRGPIYSQDALLSDRPTVAYVRYPTAGNHIQRRSSRLNRP